MVMRFINVRMCPTEDAVPGVRWLSNGTGNPLRVGIKKFYLGKKIQ